MAKLRLATMKQEAPVDPITRIVRELSELDADRAIERIGVSSRVDRALKTTVSLCPECLEYVPAIVFERAGRVILARHCAVHGPSEALIESDARYYALSNKDRHGRRFADDRVYFIPELEGASSC